MEYPFKDLLPLDEVLEREGYYKDWTHLDPKVFYSLTQISEYIKTKGFGVDVRLLIAQLAEHFSLKTSQINQIELFFKDIMQELAEDKDFHSLPEIAGARRGYSTLAESLNNLSVSMINKNLGKLDQSFMSEEFLQQMAGDTPINMVPADGSVGNTKLDEYVFSKVEQSVTGIPSTNLFNKDTITPDRYVGIGTGGELRPPANQTIVSASDFIDVVPNAKYWIRYFNQLAFYTKSGDFISGLDGNHAEPNTPTTITIPSDAYKMRITVTSTMINSQQISAGEDSVEFEPFGSKVGVENLTADLKFELSRIEWTKPTNLFNQRNITEGYYVRGVTGELAPNEAYTASEYIKVDELQSYTVRYFDQLAFYTTGKDYISGMDYAEVNPGELTTFTTPEGTGFMRLSVKKIHLDTQQLNRGSELLPYEPATGKIKAHQIETRQVEAQLRLTPKEVMANYLLEGGESLIIGDSNSAGVGTTGYVTNGELIGNTTHRTAPNAKNWANRLMGTINQINPDCVMKNWSVSGWNTNSYISGGLDNFIGTNVKLVIIMLGTNDRIATTSTNSGVYKSRLNEIVGYLESRSINYILMSPIPATVANDNDTSVYSFDTFEVNNIVREVANEHGRYHIDNYDWFLRYAEEHDDDSVLYSDGLHMTDFGSYNYLYRNIISNLGISYRREDVNR